MWRSGAKKLAVGSALILGVAGAASIAAAGSDDATTSFKIRTIVPLRLLRDSLTAVTIAFDYEYSMWGLKEGTTEWSKAKHEVHNRCAQRIQELCFRNGGIYIKLGQYISQLDYIVPQEYVQIMRASLLKRCPVSSYDQVRKVFIKELGGPPEEIFDEFDPIPLASASIAQVHSARTRDGKRVAVKVQHTHLTDTAVADIATVDLIVTFLHWCFPAFDYRWLVDEIRENAPKELNFLLEARNSEKCLDNFRRLSPHIADFVYAPKIHWDLSTSKLLTMEFMEGVEISDVSAIRKFGIQPHHVSKLELNFLLEARNSEKCLDNFRRLSPHIADFVYAPKIHWDLSTSKLLTMEFMEGVEISDVSAIRKFGIQPHHVSKLVSQAFAEMIFRHGFVHCDPHAANMMVRPMQSSRWNIFGRENPQLILLDHGLYRELDFATRTNYAALWKALVFADVDAIKEYSVKLGAGEDLYVLFAGILTMRPWNKVINPSVDHLVLEGTNDDRSELQTYASLYFPQISELLRRLPRVILLLLKTNDCLRAVNRILLKEPSVETFFIIGRVSSEVVAENRIVVQRMHVLSRLSMCLEQMLLDARLLSMRIALWLLQLRKAMSGSKQE